ncbi:MAG: response regulator transcription factor, partial [Bacteroidota bacterium]
MNQQVKTIRVAIIEDHPEIRQGMEFLINSHPDFACDAYSSAEDAIDAFRKKAPEIVLMDIGLPGMDGIECTRKIKKEFEGVLVMMCTVYEDDEKIFKALTAGASGYILKRSAGDHLLQSIRELHEGGAPMSSTIAKKVVTSFQKNRKVSAEEALLTDRENQILDLLSHGFRNKEIAEQLFVSVNTIR